MDREKLNQHLSQISTAWTVFRQAHVGPGGVASEAQGRLLQRYGAAIYRYLLGALRNQDAADELFQDFALRFVRGDFHRADPERGRFRDFLKTALFHLIVDDQRRRKTVAQPLPEKGQELASPQLQPTEEDDLQFLTIWRAELLDRAWDGLAELERQTGQPLHTVLRFRAENPGVRSPQMAEQLAGRLARRVTADWIRKRLFLAREKFADLLLDEVAQSLASPTPEVLEQELIDLGLLEHCKSALSRRKP